MRVRFCGVIEGSILLRNNESPEEALRRAETELCELMYRRAKRFSDDSQGPNIGLELQEEEIAP